MRSTPVTPSGSMIRSAAVDTIPGSPSSSHTGPRARQRCEDEAFVGREHELGVLDALLAQVRTDGARVALIRGAPGIGKTALVRRVPPPITAHLMAVRGSGDEGEATVSYALVDQLFAAVGLRAAALLAHTERVLPVEEPIVVGRQILAALTRSSARGPGGGRDRRRALGRRRLAARAALRAAQAGRTPRADDPGGAVGRRPPARRARAARRGAHRGHPGGRPAGTGRRPGPGRHRDRVRASRG